MDAVEELLDAGAKRISAHQLMLLHGAELATPDARRKFRFDTRFRVVARNLGNYIGEPVVEVEEMVVATPDLSFEDYFETARLPPAADDLLLRGQLRRAT